MGPTLFAFLVTLGVFVLMAVILGFVVGLLRIEERFGKRAADGVIVAVILGATFVVAYLSHASQGEG